MRLPRAVRLPLASLCLIALSVGAVAGVGAAGGAAEAEEPAGPELVDTVREVADRAAAAGVNAMDDPQAVLNDPQGSVDPVINPPEEAEPAPPGADDGFGNSFAAAFGDRLVLAGLAGLGATLAGLAGFALVTRYISPKEALQNPQRAMLYGYVRGHPGVHLKQLAEEFAMKTSSILWHIRKLESAELVHSERANGFRVFYPVEGGIEIRRVSRAITALQNRNAQRIFGQVQRKPGDPVRSTAEALNMHGGTVRWHLRKLRDFGLVEELVRDDGSRFFPTPLGKRAIETLEGKPVAAPRGARDGTTVPLLE
jgi:DNA-binding transcriptional ArsR family regulator